MYNTMMDNNTASMDCSSSVFGESTAKLGRKEANSPKCAFCQNSFSIDIDQTGSPRPLMKCAGCLVTFYCNRDHQRSDWPRHKGRCQIIQTKLAALASKQAAARLAHGTLTSTGSSGFLSGGGFGSNSDLSVDTAMDGNGSTEISNDQYLSVDGSMADLVSASPYTTKGEKQATNPKRARFPLTVIRERRTSIGAGEASRIASSQEMESKRKRPAVADIEPLQDSEQSSGHNKDKDCSISNVQTMQAISIPNLPGKIDHRRNKPLDLLTDPRFRLDAKVPRQIAFNLRVRYVAACVAASLHQFGWCVVDHFLGDPSTKAIYNEATSLYMTPGLFADGQLMKTPPDALAAQVPDLKSPKHIRSDQIYWYDNRVEPSTHISFLISMVDSIIYRMAGQLPPYNINGRSRAMIACYPGEGTKYIRHVDNPDRDGRAVTTIYYLNEHWKREHGGMLRLYPETSPSPVDIQPLFDRLLFFWSDMRNPHEVLPSFQSRFAITIWYFDGAERTEALAREQRYQEQIKSSQSNLNTTKSESSPEPSSSKWNTSQTSLISNSGRDVASRLTPSTMLQDGLRLDSRHGSLDSPKSIAGQRIHENGIKQESGACPDLMSLEKTDKGLRGNDKG